MEKVKVYIVVMKQDGVLSFESREGTTETTVGILCVWGWGRLFYMLPK
ncbi:hypothetical protein [Arenibacter aquaticus]|nr:hypothetical protein [Arenibacter aquaticus]